TATRMERTTRYGSYIPVTTIGIAPILIRDQWATHPPIYLQAYHNRIPGAIGSTEAQRSGLVLNRVRLLAASASDWKVADIISQPSLAVSNKIRVRLAPLTRSALC